MDSAFSIITHFYPADTPFRRLLIKHSEQVRDKALQILDSAKDLPKPPFCFDIQRDRFLSPGKFQTFL